MREKKKERKRERVEKRKNKRQMPCLRSVYSSEVTRSANLRAVREAPKGRSKPAPNGAWGGESCPKGIDRHAPYGQ